LSVRISNPAKHSPPSRRFEALIDTGASYCIFHSDIGRAVGIEIERGEHEQTVGVSGALTAIYIHTVSLYIATEIIKIRAAFSHDLPLAGLLGRRGFLEHFKFIFDPSSNPPEFELQRILRT
jgi:predicted aspartyl protease